MSSTSTIYIELNEGRDNQTDRRKVNDWRQVRLNIWSCALQHYLLMSTFTSKVSSIVGKLERIPFILPIDLITL
ncbi:hypothetical protein MTR_3g095760 [Medicago truncatula]|uniref:Uncharacterized protein n=1 Tax=Medicago truncatula TaxID=3880 RepID=G7JAZ6_MEDTR|nr:hypothetical protein MTR_3g095760 [Medicago truncatula]